MDAAQEKQSLRLSSKKSEIVSMLTLFGIRRQSKLDKEDYKVYASDLERFELGDIDSALVNMCRHPRQQWEAAFPEVAQIIEAIKTVRQARTRPDFDAIAAYMRDVRAHTGNYVHLADIEREIMEKRRREGKPVWNFKFTRGAV